MKEQGFRESSGREVRETELGFRVKEIYCGSLKGQPWRSDGGAHR